MVGAVIALQIGMFWTQWQNLSRLTAIETRVANLEGGLARVEDQLGQVESRLTGIEGSFETRRSEP
jgi:hypothetical protein